MQITGSLLRTLALGVLAWFLPLNPASATEVIDSHIEKWTGDFEDMLERRRIRALVVPNRLMYFLDGPVQRGTSYESLQHFARFIDEKYKLGARRMKVVYIPVTRDKLIPYLKEGIGDVAVANLTITPERLAEVDFSEPILDDVREILVTGPSAPEIRELADLGGKTVYARYSSSYFAHLEWLNEQLEQNGFDPVNIVPADENLEDSDLLEMVNAGLLPMVIVDSHKAEFWGGIFDNIVVRHDVAVTVGGKIGWAFRKNSPTLGKVLAQYIGPNRKGSAVGNTIYNRYLKENKWVKNAYSDENIRRYQETAEFFRQYAGEYGFDWLMLIAQGYQESGLDQSVRSPSGAIGIMQLLPSTAADPNVGIKNIDDMENNIHAGTKYMRFLRDQYFDDPEIDPLNQTLLSFAAYNAGPGRMAEIREETRERGLDPNTWFGNVERIVARRIGRETVDYVGNIYKYYIAYKLLSEQGAERVEARRALEEELD